MRLLPVVLLCASMVACSSGEPERAAGSVSPSPSPSPDGAGAAPWSVTVSGSFGSKPQIDIKGSPPAGLQIEDVTTGNGPEAPPGATVTVHYVGVAWGTKKEFDSSFGEAPVQFPLANVIPGWREGIPGMRVGGRRRLVIPPELGYPNGTPDGSIGPGETLVFVIDLLNV